MSKKFYTIVLGCQMNESDAERIKGLYNSFGFEETKDEKDADIITVVSCAVRQAAMDRINGHVKKWNETKRKKSLCLVLTGCVLPADQEKLQKVFDIYLPIKNISNIHEKFESFFNTSLPHFPISDYFSIKPDYNNVYTAYVPIMTGCNKFCTYCAVPYTRGKEISRPYEDIVSEVKELIKKGYKEIILLGQNVNSYALDLPDQSEKFPELLHDINLIEGDFWIRFMTSHPYDMSDSLLSVLAEKKHICESFHLPLQSGDDGVLKTMNRHYTVDHFMERIGALRNTIPEISLSTDIIVGFPSEDENAFQNTVKTVKKCCFDMAYIARYSERPGTVSEKTMDDVVSEKEKIRRENIINDIVAENALAYNKHFLSKTIKILVEKAVLSKEKEGLYKNTGKNRENKTVVFTSGRDYTGSFVDVKITRAHSFAIEGELI